MPDGPLPGHDGGLGPEDQADVLKALVALTGDTQDPDLRRVAQFWLSELIGMTALDKKAAFETLEVPNGADGGRFKVKIEESESGDAKILTVRWASADACQAWWKKFGADAKWDVKRRRFLLPTPL